MKKQVTNNLKNICKNIITLAACENAVISNQIEDYDRYELHEKDVHKKGGFVDIYYLYELADLIASNNLDEITEESAEKLEYFLFELMSFEDTQSARGHSTIFDWLGTNDVLHSFKYTLKELDFAEIIFS